MGENEIMRLIYYVKKFISFLDEYGFMETIKCLPIFFRKKLKIYPYEKPYDSFYQNDEYLEVQTKPIDIKAIAFYLPQFHTIPENDNWWGEGFTEWTNTEKAEPRFDGHYQPRRPHKDFGFYDLGNVKTIEKQVDLAKRHGIYGFCFYYYWFSGKRLLEKPLNLLLDNTQISMPFCVCWANENWTRTWSGNQKDILIEQQYEKDAGEAFIKDLYRYLEDPRYIRVDGKPVILVYNPAEIPDIEDMFNTWRRGAKIEGIGEIEIWCCNTDSNTTDKLLLKKIVDSVVDFPPRNIDFDKEILIKHLSYRKDGACVYDYSKMVDFFISKYKNSNIPYKHIPTCMMGWDNTARKKVGWHCFYGYSLKSFYKWIRAIVKMLRAHYPKERRFMFINAWNEWAEGTYLEPDEKFGYANINILTKAIYK